MAKIGTNGVFNLNFPFSSEFAYFVAGEIIQVIEAIPGSVVPLAMFYNLICLKTLLECHKELPH